MKEEQLYPIFPPLGKDWKSLPNDCIWGPRGIHEGSVDGWYAIVSTNKVGSSNVLEYDKMSEEWREPIEAGTSFIVLNKALQELTKDHNTILNYWKDARESARATLEERTVFYRKLKAAEKKLEELGEKISNET